MIDFVQAYKTSKGPIDFGYYINADEITRAILKKPFDFSKYDITVTDSLFKNIVYASGLINDRFTESQFLAAYRLRSNKLTLILKDSADRIAQIIADYLRKHLLKEEKRFSFETVFSHESKLDIMRQAKEQGYKVYLYFVSTESPVINIERVEARKRKGGHDVPADLIRSRYFRSLDFLFDACGLAYQAFFFDNSKDNRDSKLFAHFKLVNNAKKWDKIDRKNVPQWFKKYYSARVKKK